MQTENVANEAGSGLTPTGQEGITPIQHTPALTYKTGKQATLGLAG